DKDSNKNVVGSLGTADELGALIHQRQWNDYVVIAQGNHLQHFINGRQMVDVVDDCEAKRAASGVLALQLHAGPPMMAQFKNIRIKQLSTAAAGGDLGSLQGQWDLASAEADGAPVESEDLKAVVLTIKNDAYSVVFPDRTDEGTLKLDAAKQPHQMDILPGSGPNSGQTLLGIYQLDGRTLQVCYGRDGAARPTEFKAESGSSNLLIVW